MKLKTQLDSKFLSFRQNMAPAIGLDAGSFFKAFCDVAKVVII
jgi:hypothetical protein